MARKLPRFLTLPEVQEMMKKAVGRDRLILKCFFYLGLRCNELRCLQREDIDLINRTVKVVQGKGKKDRYVPIPLDSLAEELQRHIEEKRTGPLIFGRDKHNHMSNRHFRRIIKRYAEEAGVRKPEEIHPHTLRHSYATILQNNGAPLNEIQRLLGHKNIETTTIYTHLGIEDLKRTVMRVFEGK